MRSNLFYVIPPVPHPVSQRPRVGQILSVGCPGRDQRLHLRTRPDFGHVEVGTGCLRSHRQRRNPWCRHSLESLRLGTQSRSTTSDTPSGPRWDPSDGTDRAPRPDPRVPSFSPDRGESRVSRVPTLSFSCPTPLLPRSHPSHDRVPRIRGPPRAHTHGTRRHTPRLDVPRSVSLPCSGLVVPHGHPTLSRTLPTRPGTSWASHSPLLP